MPETTVDLMQLYKLISVLINLSFLTKFLKSILAKQTFIHTISKYCGAVFS